MFGLWSLSIQMEAVKNFDSICYINFGTFLVEKLFGRFNTASTEGKKKDESVTILASMKTQKLKRTQIRK